MQLLGLLIIAMIFSIAGEIFCKCASTSSGIKMYAFMACSTLSWGVIGSVTWMHIYRLKTINEILVLYNPVHLMILAGTGVLIFSEPFTWKMALTLALLCVCFCLQK